MSNKTPYEIRLELLQMAMGYLETAQSAQRDFTRDAFFKAAELQNLTLEQAQEQLTKYMPKPYSMDDVMKKAAEMYSFVSKKD